MNQSDQEQDDLPPGIDEPSLPALPDFSNRQTRFRSSSHPQVAPVIDHGHEPPSFDASEAAQAVGGVAISRNSVVGELAAGMGVGEAPPGYFGGTSPAGSGQGGPPAYS